MMQVDAARRYPVLDARLAAATLAVPLLALVGYLSASDVRLALALVGIVALGAWTAFSLQRPHLALPFAFPMLLVAGTKFRLRDATASLDGSMDAQVLMELGLFGFIGVGLLAAWYAAGDRRRPTLAELAVASFAGIALLSTLWSAAPALTLVRAVQLAIIGGLAIAATRVLGPARALWIALAALVFHVIVCAISPLVFEPVYPIDDPGTRGRLSWFAVHPIDVGTMGAIAALGMLSAAWFAPAGRRARLFGMPAAVLALPTTAVLLFASTRGALAAFLGAVGVLVLLRLHGTLRWPLALTGAATLLLAFAYGPDIEAVVATAASESALVERVVLRDQSVDTVLEMNGRLQLWREIVPVITDNLLTGYGYQASRAVLLATASWAAYAHNALIQTLLDLGVFGGLALLSVIAVALRGLLREDLGPWLRAAVAALAAFLVVNSISTESFAAAPGFDALMLFLCALCAGSPRPAEGELE